MTAPSRRATLLALPALALALARCSTRRGDTPRCAFCGMRVPADSHWASGAVARDARALLFDTPGCLFRYRLAPRGAGMRGEWVTEYYGPARRRTDARAVRYAVGSDVVGPMGPDVIPVEPARADVFARDHHARATLAFDDVTADVLAHL